MTAVNHPWLYVPWLREHGDSLIADIAKSGEITFAPISLFPATHPGARHNVALLARLKGQAYRRAARARLLASAPRASGLVVTFDWSPAMRIIVEIAREIGLPTVLIPHEGAFFDRNVFYGGTDVAPITDAILGWGSLHRDIFVERGYDPARITLVGSTKLAAAGNYQAALTPEDWRARLALPRQGAVVVFAMQPLDNVADPVQARAGQRAAIVDTAMACAEAGLTLLVRPPPAGGADLLPDPTPAPFFAVAPGPDVARAAHETIAQSVAVVSIGSTMLVEAAAMGKPVLALAYAGLRSGFAEFGLESITGKAALIEALGALSRGGTSRFSLSREFAVAFGLPKAASSPQRKISACLTRLARETDLLSLRAPKGRGRDAIDRFIALERLGLPPKLRKLLIRPDAFFRDLSIRRRSRA